MTFITSSEVNFFFFASKIKDMSYSFQSLNFLFFLLFLTA